MERELDELINWLSFSYSEPNKPPPVILFSGVAIYTVPSQSNENTKQIFYKNVLQFSLFHLYSIMKGMLRDFLPKNGFEDVNEKTEFEPLIKKFKEYLVNAKKDDLIYIAEYMEAYRKIRNSFEYREGEVAERDFRPNQSLDLSYPVFTFFAIDENGKEHYIDHKSPTLPENSSLNLKATFESKSYTVGQKIELPTTENLLCTIINLKSFFFGRGLELTLIFKTIEQKA